MPACAARKTLARPAARALRSRRMIEASGADDDAVARNAASAGMEKGATVVAPFRGLRSGHQWNCARASTMSGLSLEPSRLLLALT